jgi:hypothetical protein
MQHLEFSGAVRTLYGSLGVKGLIETFKEWDREAWTGLIWLRIGAADERL